MTTNPPVDRAALAAIVRATATFVGDTYRGEWADDASTTLESDADRIERGEPCSLLRLAGLEVGAQPEPATARAAVLSVAERAMLTYALNQAQLRMWSRGGFTDEDQAAVNSLRRMAAEAQPPAADTAAGARVERLALTFEVSGNEFIAERIRAAVAGAEARQPEADHA